ncbi:NAD(P)-binding protein, partial [Lophium mytilinum]
MPSQPLNFSTVLITGGAGGIGRALATHFISTGKKVIIAGRTASSLKTTASEIGAAAYYVLDTGDTASIPSFIATLVKEHPDLDCLINNAGVQRPLQVLEDTPEDFLKKADAEIDINIRGPLHLALGLLPHFRGKKEGGGATIVNVSSVLGFVPFSVINPVYNGTKAWLHFWSVNLRSQLEGTGVRVVEIAPPMVATDLHREREDPDDNKKEKNQATLEVGEFVREVVGRWEEGEETISAGMGVEIVGRWEEEFGGRY